LQQVAAFDLDGTILDGESPLKLTTSLLRHHQLPWHKAIAMGWWGLRYRMRLPQTESTPRELLFSALTEPTVEEVDEEILEIYDKRMRKHIRPGAIREIKRCHDAGMKTVLASASFKPITTQIVSELGLDGQISTIMEERDGHYTGRVVGVPVQGREKQRLLVQYCNDHFGMGNWVIERAYSDHYSDIPMLEMAVTPIIIDPDGKLERVARRRGWEIADWDE
jgi:HAD superfamily hydrolase (TIGR01490 family)